MIPSEENKGFIELVGFYRTEILWNKLKFRVDLKEIYELKSFVGVAF